MKCLFVLCNFTYGGIEQYVLNLIDNIDREKFDISVMLPQKECDRLDDLIKKNVNIVRYNQTTFRYKVKTIYKHFNENKYDVIHLLLGHDAYLFCKIARFTGNRQIIVHAQSSQSGNQSFWLKQKCKKLIFYFIGNYFNRNVKCIACSKDAANFMFGKNNNAQIIFNGIDVSKFKHSMSGDANRICINARFDTPKNPIFAVEVIAELVKKNPELQVDWIGNGPLENQVLNKVKELNIENKITFISKTNKVSEYLAKSQWFLLPSLNEGLPISLIEAQCSGMKCFISDGIPSGGDAGGCIVIPLSKNASEWADIITEEMNKGIPTISYDKLMKFDISTTVKELEKMYCSL